MTFERRSAPKTEKPHVCPKPWFNPLWLRYRVGARWRCGALWVEFMAQHGERRYAGGCGQLWERRYVGYIDPVLEWRRIDG